MKARIRDGMIVELFAGDLSGKYHPDIIAMLVDVPENAQAGWVQTNGVWGPKPPPEIVYTADDVRNEAQRRIIALVGARDFQDCLVKQLNAQMRATELVLVQSQNGTWTEAEAAEAAALQGLADAIKAIRAASNVLEVASPIPADYTDNSHWQTGA